MRKIYYADAITSNITSSKGNQEKFHIENEWIKIDTLGYESASEYFSSRLLENSNIDNFVSYSIEKIQIENKSGIFRNRIANISPNFLSEGSELITLDKLLKQRYGTTFELETKNKSLEDSIFHIVNLIEQATGIQNYGKWITAVLEFDAFILNEDRHAQNIAFIFQNGKYKPSPIFDNGAAFLSDITRDYPLDEKTNKLISSVNAKPFSKSFKDQVVACQSLYGKQFVLNSYDIGKDINLIKQYYGNKIATRIQHIYDVQKFKTRSYIQIQECQTDKKIYLSDNIDFVNENKNDIECLLNYFKNGGIPICSEISQNFFNAMKNMLIDEEIPFIISKKNDNCFLFITGDMFQRDFKKVLNIVYSRKDAKYQKLEKEEIENFVEKYDKEEDYEKE